MQRTNSGSGDGEGDASGSHQLSVQIHTPTTKQERYEMKKIGQQIIKQRPWYTWILVGAVFILLGHTYGTYLITFCLPLLFIRPFVALFYFVISAISVGLTVYCYLKTVFTHPGLVPREFHLDEKQVKKIQEGGWNDFMLGLEARIEALSHRDGSVDDTNVADEEDSHEEDQLFTSVEKSRHGEVRCCQTCYLRKPDRTHHCRQCGHCVLKMDHHCPWVNNCVGFYNFKYFILFVFYTMLSCWIITFSLIASFAEVIDQPSSDTFEVGFREVNLLWSFFIAFAFGASLLIFLGYHFNLVISNTTTLESMAKYSKFMKQYKRNPYDLGPKANFQAVLGEKWYLWLIPTLDSIPGHGTSFPIRRYATADDEAQLSIQIEDSS